MSFLRAAVCCSVLVCALFPANAQQLDGMPLPDNCTTTSVKKNGVECIIQSSREITKPRASCGKSEDGRINNAKFLAQHLRYQHLREGKVVATFYDNREIFQDCLDR